MTKIVDLFIYDGWKILFQVSLSILRQVKNQLFTCKEDEIVNVIRKYPKFINTDKVLVDSLEYKISNRMISELSYILTQENQKIRNLNIIYDLKQRKKKWQYETES